MHLPTLTGLVAAVAIAGAGPAADAGESDPDFRGWQGMRVVEQKGQPNRLRTVAVDAEGQHRLVVVNPRKARLAVYRWLPPDQREAPPDPAEGDNANALPMAPELDRTLITTEQLPRDALSHDVDGDGQQELIVLVSGPGKVLIYDLQSPDDAEEAEAEDEQPEPTWQKTREWDLLDGSLKGRGRLMLLRPNHPDKADDPADDAAAAPATLMISCQSGIQTLTLDSEARAQWLEPKAGDRANWWLMDLDGDGDRDLVTWSPSGSRSVRWYKNVGGALRPPQGLLEQSANHAAALSRISDKQPAELLILGGQQEGLVRRYQFSHGEANPLGRWQSLQLPGGRGTAWAGVRLGDRKVLVANDPDRPRLVVHPLTDDGWASPESFPVVSDIQALAAPATKPGTLLIWAKDAGNLYTSHWQDGRFTFPKVNAFEADGSDRKILTLDQTGRTTWWVQRVGAHLDLYTWGPQAKAPKRTRFKDVGKKTDNAKWLGGQRLLVKEQYARHPKLVEKHGDKTASSQPAHVKRTELSQYRLYDVDGTMKAARLSDGVLRWLDEKLHASDQIMLEGGQDLSSYVPIDQAGHAWALQRGGDFVHKLKPDEAGIPRLQKRLELPGGEQLLRDPVLGLMLTNDEGIVRLAPGQPPKLEVAGSIKGEDGFASMGSEPTIHRLFTTDLTGDGRMEVVLSDDARHKLTAMGRHGSKLTQLISWPVFDDRKYPYGRRNSQSQVTQPRALTGLDLDGDGHQDLAMLSHDRLIFYLGREQSE